MKLNLIPVVLTAAVTSVLTLAVATHVQRQVPYFAAATSPKGIPLPVNYTAYGAVAAGGSPVNFEAAAESSVRAVVHIKTATKARTVAANSADMGDIFSQLFGQRQYYIPSQVGSGSGVVISPDGYVVTNNHVVADASELTVTFNDRYTTKAKVIGTDPATDIAVLKVETDKDKPLQYMEFGNSDDVKLGQWVLAVGYPLTLDATVTAGIISAKSRSIGINRTQSASAIESFIQTDAAVNPGNSGGALVSTGGQLVGINSAIASPTGSYAGYSYAIPANIVRKAVNDLIKYGSVQRAYMGISYLDARSASPEQIAELGIDKADGVYVMGVKPGSGADKAGFKKGDFITHINNEPVNNQSEVQEQIARFQPGDNVSVTYTRGGKENSTTVRLTNLNGTTDIIKGDGAAKILGASFRPLTDEERSKLNVDGGVMVTDIGSGAIAKQTQMRKGFIITGVNETGVNTLNDLQLALSAGKNMQLSGFYPTARGMYYYVLKNVDVMAEQE